jgi:Membrane proteins related to metalloendopeptidases
MVSVPNRIRPFLPRLDGRSVPVIRKKRKPAKSRRIEFIILRAALGFCIQAALALFVYSYISFIMSGQVVFTAYINGREAVSVSDPSVIDNALHTLTLVSTELSADFGDGALPPIVDVPDFGFDINYKFTLSSAVNPAALLSDSSECKDTLYKIIQDQYTYAFTVYADNINVASSAHYNDAAQAVDRIEQFLTEEAINSGEDVDEVRISTDIKVEYGLCDKSRILSADGLYTRLSELLASNTTGKSRITAAVSDGVDPDIDYGINRVITCQGVPVQSVSLTAPALLTENIKLESGTSLINYKTVYVESSDYYVGQSFIQTEGVAGLESITYDLVMNSGEETSRRVATHEVVQAAVDEVIVVGTRELPQAVPTGTFDYPVNQPYEITSYFGEQRVEYDGDAYHYGVDFVAGKGDPIYAADGGTIIYAGYSKSYGLMIKIDHGSGLVSCYAHCSKLLYGVGDAVYKGQQIAEAGDTGAATGPHLHFEIRKNGMYVNPMKYLEK